MNAIKDLDLRPSANLLPSTSGRGVGGEGSETLVRAPQGQVNVQIRNYAAGDVNRLSTDMKIFSLSADGEIRYKLKVIRARARDLAANNDHAKKYLAMVVQNVIGPNGISLQINTLMPGLNGADTVSDVYTNKLLKDAFDDWGKRGTCTVDGKYSWTDVQQVVAESKARDGEIFVRMIKGWKGNKYRFALQLLESDYCDELLNRSNLPNGNEIRMGIEFDPWGRPAAYWFLTKHPGDYPFGTYLQTRYQRIPAEEVLHIFNPGRPGMSRGVTRFSTVMLRLYMIGKSEEAALVNFRAGASKMGFYERTADAIGMPGDKKDDDGEFIDEVSPGMNQQLPAGWTFKPNHPAYPNGEFGPFRNALLMASASGLNVSYCSLASDPSAANFSSMRATVLEERDGWRIEQKQTTEQLCQPTFEAWLDTALLAQAIGWTNKDGSQGALPYSKFYKFNAATWHPRGWDWVDPLKDQNANVAAVDSGMASRTEILAKQGKNVEEVFKALANEKKLAEELGINIEPVAASASKPESVPPAAPE